MQRNNNSPIVVIGPSGSGKTTLIDLWKHDGDIIADIKQDVLSYEARTGKPAVHNLKQIYKSFFMELDMVQPTIIELAADYTGFITSELNSLYDDYTLIYIDCDYTKCVGRQFDRVKSAQVPETVIKKQLDNSIYWIQKADYLYSTDV